MTIESHYSKIFNVGEEKYRIRIVARGIIMEGSKFLVCKNSTNTFLPGGHLEFGDNLKYTLKKEIMEELGLECTVDKYIGCVDCIWKEKDIFQQQVDHVFLVKGIDMKNIIESKEKQIRFYWIDINDMEEETFGPRSSRDLIKNFYDGINEIQYFSENQIGNPLV